jgi:LysR substrate binding domain
VPGSLCDPFLNSPIGACGIFSRRGWVFQFLQINHDHPPFNLIGGLDSASEPITSRTHTTAAAPSGKSMPKTTLAGSWLGKSVWGSQGAPRDAQDLKHHVAVLVRLNIDHWNVGREVVRVRWRISAGSLAVTQEAVLAGMGLMRVPEFVVKRDLKSGALVRLLPDVPLPIAHATALYPRSKVSSRALRSLLDHLSKRSSDNLA